MPELPTCAVYVDPIHGELLTCDLPPNHAGKLHFDEVDQIWWMRDGDDDA